VALLGLFCADVPLGNYSLTPPSRVHPLYGYTSVNNRAKEDREKDGSTSSRTIQSTCS